MALNVLSQVDIIEIMENYLMENRPPEDIRSQLDLGYKIDGQSVLVFEIRPKWDDSGIIMEIPFAKTTYVKAENCWKIYWMRASGKWWPYDPHLKVSKLTDFINIIQKDELGCFFG
jgi:Protein of unknown function (DUF3024)